MILMPALSGLVVEGVHHLLVVQAPRKLGWTERVADGVGLPRIRLVDRDRLVDLLHPPGLLGRDHGMREQPPRAREIVDHVARLDDLLVGQEPPARIVEWRAGEQRDVGVAVVVDLLDEVLEFVPDQRGGIALQRRVPVVGGELGEIQELLLIEVVAHEVGLDIEDELSGQALRAGSCQLGLAGFGGVDLEDPATIDLVHGEEGRRHAAARLHELPAAQPEPFAVLVGELEDAPLDTLLRFALRRGKVLAVRYNLGRYRRCS